MMKMRNVLLFVALAFIVAGVAGFMYFWPVTTTVTPHPIENVACTLDAKACPDGSFVGRVAPNCEFAACPGPSQNGNENVACDADVFQCPDGHYVSRQGPACEFISCDAPVVNGVPKLPSHETLADIAGCTNEQKEWMWAYGEKKSWKCTALESNIESTNFPTTRDIHSLAILFHMGWTFPH
ncbi:MAG: hypothetical protein IPJ89_03470 [Candidatus Iainarchaeum archaeon]|uniref:Uncharacterized protein n=1 Tax=Candidatus Iainarchaeum sp. TaxID=3101447 RepID=A0A7T9I199_9ARCH|nr:MAG: hypothetical protein IPJ89_03470 [Candidatus Diapherotrites archaeon]